MHAIEGIGNSISVGQVAWAPSAEGSHEYLVFTGWSSENRKFGIKYCYNRPCALYAVKVPFLKSESSDSRWVIITSNTLVQFTSFNIFFGIYFFHDVFA